MLVLVMVLKLFQVAEFLITVETVEGYQAGFEVFVKDDEFISMYTLHVFLQTAALRELKTTHCTHSSEHDHDGYPRGRSSKIDYG